MATLRPANADKVLSLRGRLATTAEERDAAIKEHYAAPFAERFSVSKEAMRIRLEELKLFVENRPRLLF
jgi:Zn-dependent peptidase ImmA (M78 family)